ncbi:hypothetical protein F6X40_35300 [Paraburkholderia sp. UCT31]|uniref:hypothetical protein n=1 Tax=Paraburkholderia sp. UCT31 TaxID=2615209 RepID=UPI001654C9DD|nr:hypothetical protein [Paraburkholderia sp. UCT31]MBC8741817.1 hypothetical protein [Paraburkholderia sp. UCT31]
MAGFRVFPRARQIVAADHGSSGSAEESLARFELLVRENTLAGVRAHITPDFEGVADKRMSELTELQQDDAHELWLRAQIGWFSEYHQRHLKLLLKRLDEARAVTAPSA